MDLGLISPEMTGHLNPSLTLGRELARREHRVTVISTPGARAKVQAAGLDFRVIGVSEDEAGETEKGLAKLATLKGPAALFLTGRMLSRASEVYLRDLPAIIKGSAFDGLIIDQVCPAASVIAEEIDIPYVVICNALAIHHDPVSPPPPTLWRYRDNLFGRLRNELTRIVLPPLYDWATGATRVGVSPLRLCFAKRFGLAQIAQQPEFFDFPRRSLPDHFHYSGPWHEASRDSAVDFPWERLDGRPLIYASLGTIQNNLAHAYQAINEAVRGLDVQLVLSLGRRESAVQITPAENALVVPYAPQLPLLKRSSLAITHAGLNTALECLSAGVPMVCLPIANDQPGVARRVEWIGAGELLPIRRISALRLRSLISKVLSEPAYRQKAQWCAQEIVAAQGPKRAAEIIEQAFESREPVLRKNP